MTKTTPYDYAEHHRTSEETTPYLGACLEEADGEAAFVLRAIKAAEIVILSQ